ncbi:MAG TPA: T9SS type A sorting domain-containing protein, partial [Candidatus Cloacimonadota bacterium]|nr:T9SS type A sorting domain-containing protein [Candidatus Cloacimonadota bacterium]
NHNMEMFGWCLTMGDYNGDGYCDAAISAPFDYASWPYPGEVIVYAGNPQLNDPTPIADNTNTPEISKLQIYPNPLQPQKSELNVKFGCYNSQSPESKRELSTFEIYNIKGQKVKSYSIDADHTKKGTASYNLENLSSGVYICILTTGQRIQHGKITIIR